MARDPNLPETLTERIVYLKTWSKTVRRIIEALPDWITPNRVTVARGLLALPVFWALSSGRYWTGLCVYALAMCLDAVDGAIAHVKSMGTPLGAFLDPLADKLILCAALFAVWTELPMWILTLAGASLVVATAITVVRIVRMARAGGMTGRSAAAAIAAKPAGKVKTIFDILASMLVVVGLALGSPTIIDAGGILIVVGGLFAARLHFFRPPSNPGKGL